MNLLIVGNIVALIGSVVMVIASYVKESKKTIFLQTIQMLLFVLSNLVLKGIPGVVINLLSCVRNILAYKGLLSKMTIASLLLIIIGCTVLFNNLGIIGYVPLVGTIIFTIFINSKKTVVFKMALLISVFMWLIYDIYIKSYTSAIFDFGTIVAGIISLIRLKKNELIDV